MGVKSPAKLFSPDILYPTCSPGNKVCMAVVGESLYFDKAGSVRFDSKKYTYLARLHETLAGVVPPEVVDAEVDGLVDEMALDRSDTQIFRVGRGVYKFAEGIRINPEVASNWLKMYKLCHHRN